jgi:hypothetical protein
MPLTLYMDHLSQPSRAVHMTLRFLEIPFNLVEVRVSSLENLKPEFLLINPLGKGSFLSAYVSTRNQGWRLHTDGESLDHAVPDSES